MGRRLVLFFWLGPWPVPSYLTPPLPPSTGVLPEAPPETAISESQNNSNFQANAHKIPESGRVQDSKWGCSESERFLSETVQSRDVLNRDAS